MNLEHWSYLKSGNYKWNPRKEVWVSALEGLVHSFDDQPAIIGRRIMVWGEKGICHRLAGPAKIWNDGVKEWYWHGSFMGCGSVPTRRPMHNYVEILEWAA
jgi:hypothetical protein